MITKEQLSESRKKVLEKFSAYLKADEELAEEGNGNGFIDKSSINKLSIAKKQWDEEQNNWQELLLLFMLEQRMKK